MRGYGLDRCVSHSRTPSSTPAARYSSRRPVPQDPRPFSVPEFLPEQSHGPKGVGVVQGMRRPVPIVQVERLLVAPSRGIEPAQALVHLAKMPHGVCEPQRIAGLPRERDRILEQSPGLVGLVQVQRDVTELAQCDGKLLAGTRLPGDLAGPDEVGLDLCHEGGQGRLVGRWRPERVPTGSPRLRDERPRLLLPLSSRFGASRHGAPGFHDHHLLRWPVRTGRRRPGAVRWWHRGACARPAIPSRRRAPSGCPTPRAGSPRWYRPRRSDGPRASKAVRRRWVRA